MTNTPFLLRLCQDNDSMKLSNEGHELSPDTGIQEHGRNFIFEVDLIIKLILFEINSSKVNITFLDKYPFILLNGEAIDQI